MSANSLIDPTTQKIANRYLPSSAIDPVTSINAQSGSITMLAGPNMTINTNNRILTFSATVPPTVPTTYTETGTLSLAGLYDIYDGGQFVPVLTVPVPANYQNAKMFSISLNISGTYNTAGITVENFEIYASSRPVVTGIVAIGDTITQLQLGGLPNGSLFSTNGIITVGNLDTFGIRPTTEIYVYMATTAPPIQVGTINNTDIAYTFQAFN
jgi:hypothetical protein